MKTVSTAVAALSVIGLASADFMIYSSNWYTGQLDGNYNSGGGFYLLPGPPSCDDICSHAIFASSLDDASGPTPGIRCSGCGTDGEIEELELHADSHHWTIYRNAGYQITPADGGPLEGYCEEDHNDTFESCSCGLGDNNNGERLFKCYSDITAQDMGYYKD